MYQKLRTYAKQQYQQGGLHAEGGEAVDMGFLPYDEKKQAHRE